MYRCTNETAVGCTNVSATLDTNARNVRRRSRRPTCRLWLAVIIIRSNCTCTENNPVAKTNNSKNPILHQPAHQGCAKHPQNSRFTSSYPPRSETPFANLLINQFANYTPSKDAPSIRKSSGSPHHILPEAKTHLLIIQFTNYPSFFVQSQTLLH